MGKKRIARVCILLLFTMTLGELSHRGGGFLGTWATPVLAESLTGQQTLMEKNYEEVSGACSVILNSGTKEFFQGYPVDMSFLSWVRVNYGDAAINDIAYDLFEGNHDKEVWYTHTGNSIHVLWLKYCKAMNYSSKRLEGIVWKEDTKDYSTVIDIVGDINFAEGWCTTEAMKNRPNGIKDCFSFGIIETLKNADITIANHEFALTDSDTILKNKGFNFKAATSSVSLWQELGVDILALANNHVYDYCEEGLLDTIDTLRNNGYITIGAGNNIEEASYVQYYVVNGRKIAFVNASEIERTQSLTQAADENTPGVFKCLDERHLLSVVKNADKNADYVITYVHWGFEGYLNPDQRMKSLASELVDAGADAIIGGHPHRLQGVEFIEDVPVVYSLGNFWFSTGSLYTSIAEIEIDRTGKLQLRMIPCVQRDMTTMLLIDAKERELFCQYLCDISTGIGMNPNGYVYNVKNENSETIPYAYYSGAGYAVRNPNLDLDGKVIDTIGNRR